ncbi:Uncharacterized protein TCM_033452 [Theobroma cacao]|uniref:Retrotransposon gag domain-containing protein n=1 Tax=Theobroma cacao TaxID=3641 RepID=A0A061FBV6_THECC|nr:Uncharacterized protein TCM_033452 [Theobroma cacao]
MRDRLNMQEEHLEELNGWDEEVKVEVQEMVQETLENVAERNSQLESVVDILQRELKDLRAKVCAARTEGGHEVVACLEVRLEVPKPKEFRGKRDAKEIDNFLWGLKQYFKAIGINTDDRRITAASMYLGDIALLWWRRWCDDRLGGVLNKAALAKPKDKSKGWADKGKQPRDKDSGDGKPQSKWKGKSTWKRKPSSNKEDKSKSCFLCDGPHWVRDCLKRFKLVAIASEEE